MAAHSCAAWLCCVLWSLWQDGSAMSNRKKAGGGGGGGGGGLGSSSSDTNVYELGSGARSGGRGTSSMEDASVALLQDQTQAPDYALAAAVASSASSSSSAAASAGSSSHAPAHQRSVRHLHRTHKWRLPQSGLTLCGRRWLLGAEDMCLPACSAMSFDLAILVLAAVSWRFVYRTDYPPECSRDDQSQLEAWVVLHALGYLLLLLCDLATTLSSLRSNMFQRNTQIVYLIYLRLLATTLVVGVSLVANITYFGHLRGACVPGSEQHAGSITLHRLLSVLFLTSLCSFLVFGSYFLCAYGFGPMCGKGTSESWGKHIRRWLLCYTPTPAADGRNVLESISEIFTQFFRADREWALKEGLIQPQQSVHIVPSDVLVGLALVEAAQQRRQALGHKFLKAAPRNRWQPDAFKPARTARRAAADQHNLQVTYGATATSVNAAAAATPTQAPTPNQAMTRTGDEVPATATAASSSAASSSAASATPAPASASSSSSSSSSATPAPSSTPAAGFRSPEDPVASAANGGLSEVDAARVAAAAAESESVSGPLGPEELLASQARLGVQPRLDYRDWQKVADAKHFSKFSEASYGWPLYTWNNLSCLLTCRACRCCTRSQFAHEHMIGSGCGVGHVCGRTRCCHWSLSSFLLVTGVADRDVLYAHLDASPIYYLTLDHHQRSVVVCCRGTLSVADAVIDMDAQLAPLDGYGYPGGYTHMGILENALRLRDDLDERGILASFLGAHPHYNLTVVGHSLGAATAALLTLLLRERYDTGGPPLASTTGRLSPTTRNKLTCIAYGCPLLVSLNVAHSEFALRCITSVVYNADIISRLSLASCALLKDQMISCFAVTSSSSKFQILANSLRRNYDRSFPPGADLSHAVETPDSERFRRNNNDPHHDHDHEDGSNDDDGSDIEAGPGAAASRQQRDRRHAHDSSSDEEGDDDDDENRERPADGARGGDITGQLLLGSVSKALKSLDALPAAPAAAAAQHHRQHHTSDIKQHEHQHERDDAPSTPQSSLSPVLAQPQQQQHAIDITDIDASTGGPPPALAHQLSPPGLPGLVGLGAAPNGPSTIAPAFVTTSTATAPTPASASASVAAAAAAASAGAPSSSPSSAAAAAGASPSSTSSFTQHLRKCYLPGRIYHVLPGAREGVVGGGCLGRRPRRKVVVYPSGQDTFQEVVVAKTMFSDHMPILYTLDRLHVPDAFFEPLDEPMDEALSPSPPAAAAATTRRNNNADQLHESKEEAIAV